MIKKLTSVDELFVGWSAWLDDCFWVYVGKTHKHFFGNQLYRFVVGCASADTRTEFLSSEGVQEYVFSKLH